jgi:DNA polymerase I
MEGYVIDAIPSYNSIILVLDKFRKIRVKTTFPIYLKINNPEVIAQHPSVLNYEEEIWRDLEGKEVKLYRFELASLDAYYYIKKRSRDWGFEVVNELPTVLSQTLYRLNAYPFSKVKVKSMGVELIDNGFPDGITYAKVITYDWYGTSYNGRYYIAEVNGEKMEGRIEDLELKADVVECYGIACNKVEASVKIRSKKSPVSIKGLIEWSIVSKTPIRELEKATIGKVLTTNEAWIAFKRKIIIPNIVPRVEKMRSLEELKAVDKGGLIIFPKLGCYDDVYQLDFSSMYPSLIVKYNISAETVNKCNDIETEIGHTICLREKGIVPEALEWLIKRKMELKKIDKERAEAIKWILVASFGYLGYRNSKFGKIEAYELVTYFARKTLRKTIDLAKEYGLEVLHGIIDSLIVKGEKIEDFVSEVEKETGLLLEVEKMDWVIFFPSKNGMPYPMRYIGKLSSGEIKVKGLIRSNMPKVIIEFLNDMVKALSKAKRVYEINFNSLKEIKERYKQRIIYSEDPRDYVMWIKGKPYIRGIKGFYNPSIHGYMGRDMYYYLKYLDREYEVILSALNRISIPR